MKTKFSLSSLALMLFALLGGGSFSGEDFSTFFKIILAVVGVIIVGAVISGIVQNKNQKERLKMIEEDEKNSTDFDRSVFIGDDRCKLYFDASKRKIMIMRVMTEGIKKEYIDDFEFPGQSLATYSGSVFNVYDPKSRNLLTGTYNDLNIIHQTTALGYKDKNKDVVVSNTIPPVFKTHKTTRVSATGSATNRLYNILIDECRGLIAITESGKLNDVFNYINASSLPKKRGEKSTINSRCVGNYLFIMDDFFKVLVIIGPGMHEIFNYSEIIEVSYEENGNQLYSKSTGRTVGGAIVGGVLMGGAGAVVGGLSGATTQSKEIKNMDIKILLRSTSRSTCILHFKDIDKVLKTKEEVDRKFYDTYIKNAEKAKDILSVIIDNAKQASAPIAQPLVQPVVTSSNSVADELTKLAKLKEAGILTEEEFNAQKTKLLNL